jgi:hypothetical protein
MIHHSLLLQTFFGIVFLFLEVTAFSQEPEFTYKNLSVTPAMPQEGNALSIQYTPAKELQTSENIFANVYSLTGIVPRSVRVDLIKNGDYFEGRINSHPTAKALYIEFVGSASRDNNNGQGYFIPIYKDGRPVQDAYAEIARSFGSLSSTLGLKQNSQKAIDYLDLEFTIHTASIEKFPGRYIRVLQGKKKAYTPEIEEFISRLLKKENNTES